MLIHYRKRVERSAIELCIICQISCDDTLSKASESGKCTLFKAVGLRKDDVHRRLHDEFDSLDLIPTDRIQYHRSCYKSYTSKINLEKIEPVEAQMNASACGSVRTSESICAMCQYCAMEHDLRNIEILHRVLY